MTKNATDEANRNETNDTAAAPNRSVRQKVHDALLEASDELSPARNEANGSGNSELDEALLDTVTGGYAFRTSNSNN